MSRRPIPESSDCASAFIATGRSVRPTGRLQPLNDSGWIRVYARAAAHTVLARAKPPPPPIKAGRIRFDDPDGGPNTAVLDLPCFLSLMRQSGVFPGAPHFPSLPRQLAISAGALRLGINGRP